MVAEKGDMVYLASEQAAIEVVCPDAENVRSIDGGVPFVVQLNEVAERKANQEAVNEPLHEKPKAQLTSAAPTRTHQRGV